MEGYNKYYDDQHYFYRDLGNTTVLINTKCTTRQHETRRTKQAASRDKPAAVWNKADAPYICAASLMNGTPQKNSLQMPADWIMTCLSGWLNLLAGRETAERILQKCGVQLSSVQCCWSAGSSDQLQRTRRGICTSVKPVRVLHVYWRCQTAQDERTRWKIKHNSGGQSADDINWTATPNATELPHCSASLGTLYRTTVELREISDYSRKAFCFWTLNRCIIIEYGVLICNLKLNYSCKLTSLCAQYIIR
jgi:hypothetical protein